jgi:hypothetical protein
MKLSIPLALSKLSSKGQVHGKHPDLESKVRSTEGIL